MALPSNSGVCPISKLPDDCKAQIIEYLSAHDVKNLRLASKDWEVICIPGFFNAIESMEHTKSANKHATPVERGVLSLRPQFDDMERLHEISQREYVAKHVRNFDVYIEVFNADKLLEVFHSNLEGKDRSWKMSRNEMPPIEQIIDKIKANACHWNPQILSQAFASFINLESLRMASSVCPFPSENRLMQIGWIKMWNSHWNRGEGVIDTTKAEDRFSDVLNALYENTPSLRRLLMDMVPLDAFMVHEEMVGFPRLRGRAIAPRQFKDLGVRHLDIRASVSPLYLPVHYPGSPHPSYGSGLASFISSFRGLRSLDLSLDGHWMNAKRYRDEWQTGFYDSHFPHLESLRLTDVRTAESHLSGFILNHSTTLKRLSIVHCHTGSARFFLESDFNEDYRDSDPWDSVKKLLIRFKENLKLEKFQLLCEDVYDVEPTYNTEWGPTDNSFEMDLKCFMENDFSISNPRLLEFFLFGLCPWPMEDESPLHWMRWDRLPEYKARNANHSGYGFSSSEGSEDSADSD